MTSTAVAHEVVSKEKWLEARKALLAQEKEFTRHRDELSRLRRELPWEKIEREYVFEGPAGKQTLGDLFEGRSQLIVYHFMLGPNWEEGCKSCSFLADHFDGCMVHLAHRDATFTCISRAPWPQIEAFRSRMGWRFPWVSAFNTSFNFDYGVSFSKEELARKTPQYNYAPSGFPLEEGPGLSVFYKDESGDIFHTYSTYGRGLDILIGTYNFLDFAPKGRDEDGLAFSMSWVRHHDRYNDYVLDPKETYVPPAASTSCCHSKPESE